MSSKNITSSSNEITSNSNSDHQFDARIVKTVRGLKIYNQNENGVYPPNKPGTSLENKNHYINQEKNLFENNIKRSAVLTKEVYKKIAIDLSEHKVSNEEKNQNNIINKNKYKSASSKEMPKLKNDRSDRNKTARTTVVESSQLLNSNIVHKENKIIIDKNAVNKYLLLSYNIMTNDKEVKEKWDEFNIGNNNSISSNEWINQNIFNKQSFFQKIEFNLNEVSKAKSKNENEDDDKKSDNSSSSTNSNNKIYIFLKKEIINTLNNSILDLKFKEKYNEINNNIDEYIEQIEKFTYQ